MMTHKEETTPEMEHHIFVWEGGGQNVFLLGSFNNWTKVPMKTPYGCVMKVYKLKDNRPRPLVGYSSYYYYYFLKFPLM